MSKELYTDASPSYRDTKLDAAIPPPSLRDISRRSDQAGNKPERQRNSPYAPYPNAQQRQQVSKHQHKHIPQLHPANMAPPPPPVQKPVPPLDLRTSTDFIKCAQPLDLDALCSLVQPQADAGKEDADFLCSESLVHTAVELREKGRRVPDQLKLSAKERSNPFARVSQAGFQHAGAVKLAALDAVFQLLPSSQKTVSFADLCGGPGGFTEYLFWRMEQDSQMGYGYGITLKGAEDWQIGDPSHFTQIGGMGGSGNLLHNESIYEFDAVVSNDTNKCGVDLVVADGAPHPPCQDDQQLESASFQLILRQIITMLTCLKKGGTFVCKFFDLLHEPSANLVWLLYQAFESICVTKPLASDPTSSERFLICQNLRFQHPTRLIDALLGVSGAFIPRDWLANDEDFMDYLKMRNMKFLLKQIDSLEQMELFIADPDKLCLYDQQDVRRQCLQDWHLPTS
ncbi:S-adenosyl-L-methionine-dependent methyltransferase [Hesseltinella vesiculosa]|uniref:Cap-specific mRNA (nucleoside-2'-O-)-methyltransferase 1 n=1 Tax=Hesseltinella vesiculosa TaxID=101127 RepID=A0A1X2G9H3_9FUNG|nr:S-adenosyl-L-methionine-dependent methyltransferase [Hesseltinella vesiculosa]